MNLNLLAPLCLTALAAAWAQPVPPPLWSAAGRAAYSRGTLALDSGSLAQAEQLLRTATSLDPTNSDAWLKLGSALGRQERRGESIAAFESALRADPGSDEARKTLSMAYWLTGDKAKAMETLGTSCGQSALTMIIVDPWGPNEIRRQRNTPYLPCADLVNVSRRP